MLPINQLALATDGNLMEPQCKSMRVDTHQRLINNLIKAIVYIPYKPRMGHLFGIAKDFNYDDNNNDDAKVEFSWYLKHLVDALVN